MKPVNTKSRAAADIAALAVQAATDAVSMAALGESCVHELRAILAAIVSMSAGNEVIHDLAKVGLDLAHDRHNVLDSSRESMEEKLASLKGANHV